MPTRWTVVLAARRPGGGPELAELCRVYWRPLYAFVRREGHRPHEAQDLTQEFFARLIAGEMLAGVDPGKGRFRSFLLACLRHFLSHERERARAQKRGGGHTVFSLDDPEAQFQVAVRDDLSPDCVYDRQWALTVLDQALSQVHREYEAAGRTDLFEALRETLTAGAAASPLAEVGHRLGMNEGAVRVAAHRLRRRFREALRGEVARTVDDAAEVDEEIRHLLRCL